MALSNTQLHTILDKASYVSNGTLSENNIQIQRGKETKDKIHAKGFYFGKSSALRESYSKNNPYYIYLISPDNEERRDDYSLVIFPFQIKEILPVIECIDGITPGYIQLSSNFNTFKIHNRLKSDSYCGVGYSIKVENEDSLWELIVQIKKRLELPRGDKNRLSTLPQNGLPKTKEENTPQKLIVDLLNKRS
ncbi:TPA: hypothetical protein GF603_22565 [Escherichia coli]|nr:hypothetical protein [Escherichia coli]